MNTAALVRTCGGLPAGIGLAAARAVAARTAFYVLPMQLPLLGGVLVDAVTGVPTRFYGWSLPDPQRAVTVAGLTLLGLAAAQGLAAYLDRVAMARVRERIATHLEVRFLTAWGHATHDRRRGLDPHDVRRRAAADIRTVRRAIVMRIVERPSLLLRMAFPVVMVVAIDVRLALWPLAVPVLQWALARPLRRHAGQRVVATRSARAVVAQLVQPHFARLDTLQGYDAHGPWLGRLRAAVEALGAGRTAAAAARGLSRGAAWGLTSMALAVVWWLGALRVLAGTLSIGDLVAITGFVRFLNMPTRRFAEASARDGQTVLALERLADLHRACAHPPAPLAPSLHATAGAIRLEWRAAGALEQPSTRIVRFAPRALHYITGPSGCGKTTALRLIAGLADADTGRAWVDGQEVSTCDPASVRRQIRFVAADTAVFPDTLRENLLMGRVADEEALKAACASADFSVVLNRLPMGLETPIGSGGFKLSRSERQRLGLARAFVVPPAVLLFDEPTRSLDGPSSRRVLETLVGLATRSTVVVAADAVPPTVSPHTVTALDTLGGLADEQGAVAVSTAPAMASEVPQ